MVMGLSDRFRKRYETSTRSGAILRSSLSMAIEGNSTRTRLPCASAAALSFASACPARAMQTRMPEMKV
jgi:hypothetical protein